MFTFFVYGSRNTDFAKFNMHLNNNWICRIPSCIFSNNYIILTRRSNNRQFQQLKENHIGVCCKTIVTKMKCKNNNTINNEMIHTTL